MAVPEIIRDDAVNEYPGQNAGFLGKQYGPFLVEGDPARESLRIPDIFLPQDITAARLSDRRVLLEQLDHRGQAGCLSPFLRRDG